MSEVLVECWEGSCWVSEGVSLIKNKKHFVLVYSNVSFFSSTLRRVFVTFPAYVLT